MLKKKKFIWKNMVVIAFSLKATAESGSSTCRVSDRHGGDIWLSVGNWDGTGGIYKVTLWLVQVRQEKDNNGAVLCIFLAHSSILYHNKLTI